MLVSSFPRETRKGKSLEQRSLSNRQNSQPLWSALLITLKKRASLGRRQKQKEKKKGKNSCYPTNIPNKKKKYKISLKLGYTISITADARPANVLRKWSEIRLTHMRDGWPAFPPRLSTAVADKWMSVGEHVTGDPSVAPPLSFHSIHSLFLSFALCPLPPHPPTT